MRLLTIEQTAERLAVSVTTVRTMLEKLGAVDLTAGTAKKRMIRIPESCLDQYIRGCAICTEKVEPKKAVANKAWHIERRKA